MEKGFPALLYLALENPILTALRQIRSKIVNVGLKEKSVAYWIR